MVDGYVKEINSAKTNEKKMEKFDDCQEKYNEYTTKKAEEEAAKKAEENGETTTTTTTTTTTASEGEATTTTTADPYANEVTLTKYTTTTADKDADPTVTTTTMSEEAKEYEKTQQAYNDFVFNDLKDYEATKYQYDDNTIYVIIKGDIKERMNENDMWTEDSINSLLYERYYDKFSKKMEELADAVTAERNSAAFRRFAPFKLNLEEALS